MPSGRSISVLGSAVPLQFFIGIIFTSHFHSRARQKWPDENQPTTTEWEEVSRSRTELHDLREAYWFAAQPHPSFLEDYIAATLVSQKLIDIASRPTQSPHGRL